MEGEERYVVKTDDHPEGEECYFSGWKKKMPTFCDHVDNAERLSFEEAVQTCEEMNQWRISADISDVLECLK